MRTTTISISLIFSLFLMGFIMACSSGDTPPKTEVVNVDSESSSISLDKTAGLVANGEDQVTVQVTVKDNDGQPLAGQIVQISVSETEMPVKIDPEVALTGQEGVVKATIVCQKSGALNVKAIINPGQDQVVLEAEKTVQFIPGPAASLAFMVQPSDTVPGAPITPAVQVAVVDAFKNLVKSADKSIKITMSKGKIIGTSSIKVAEGIAVFSDLVIEQLGSYTFAAKTDSLPEISSETFKIMEPVAAKLQFKVEPADNTIAGEQINPALQVNVTDRFGNLIIDESIDITLSLSTSTAPPGTKLKGTLKSSSKKGVATFTDLVMETAGQEFKLIASSPDIVTAISQPFAILPAKAMGLKFIEQPQNAIAGTKISPIIKVGVMDKFKNLVSQTDHEITLNLAKAAAGTALQGAIKVKSQKGVASFSDLVISFKGKYILQAKSTKLTTADSTEFNIKAAAAKKLVFIDQPASTMAGEKIKTPVTLAIQDQFGNMNETGANLVNLSMGSGFSQVKIDGQFPAVSKQGKVTFAELTFFTAGKDYLLKATCQGIDSAFSNTFNITPAAVSKLVFSSQPVKVEAGQTLNPPIEILLHDQFDNLVSTANQKVSLVLDKDVQEAGLSGDIEVAAQNGIAVFSNLKLNKSGNYQFTAQTLNLATIKSQPITITPAPAAKLVFESQPMATEAGVNIAPTIEISIQDAFGNLVPSDLIDITLAIKNGQEGVTLDGELTKKTLQGVATFSNLILKKSGNYTLLASASTLTPGESQPFEIKPAQPKKLEFKTQPQDSIAGQIFPAPVEIALFDSFGNRALVPTADKVKINQVTTDGHAQVNGQIEATVQNGLATFNDLNLHKAGKNYQIQAEWGNLPPLSSSTFSIKPEAATKLNFRTQPASAIPGARLIPYVEITLEDDYGNINRETSAEVEIKINHNPSGGALSGTLKTISRQGVASFTDLKIDQPGVGYTLAGLAENLPDINSNPFDVKDSAKLLGMIRYVHFDTEVNNDKEYFLHALFSQEAASSGIIDPVAYLPYQGIQTFNTYGSWQLPAMGEKINIDMKAFPWDPAGNQFLNAGNNISLGNFLTASLVEDYQVSKGITYYESTDEQRTIQDVIPSGWQKVTIEGGPDIANAVLYPVYIPEPLKILEINQEAVQVKTVDDDITLHWRPSSPQSKGIETSMLITVFGDNFGYAERIPDSGQYTIADSDLDNLGSRSVWVAISRMSEQIMPVKEGQILFRAENINWLNFIRAREVAIEPEKGKTDSIMTIQLLNPHQSFDGDNLQVDMGPGVTVEKLVKESETGKEYRAYLNIAPEAKTCYRDIIINDGSIKYTVKDGFYLNNNFQGQPSCEKATMSEALIAGCYQGAVTPDNVIRQISSNCLSEEEVTSARFFRVDVPANSSLFVEVSPLNYDLTLTLHQECGQNEITCSNDSLFGGKESIYNESVKGGTFYLGVLALDDKFSDTVSAFVQIRPLSPITIEPDYLVQGGSGTVTLTNHEWNFTPGSASFDFGMGITVNNVEYSLENSNQVSLLLSVETAAPMGKRPVAVNQGSEKVVAANAFEVAGNITPLDSCEQIGIMGPIEDGLYFGSVAAFNDHDLVDSSCSQENWNGPDFIIPIYLKEKEWLGAVVAFDTEDVALSLLPACTKTAIPIKCVDLGGAADPENLEYTVPEGGEGLFYLAVSVRGDNLTSNSFVMRILR